MQFSPQELIDLPDGTPVRVTQSYCDFEVGDIIYRRHTHHDDERSCSFSATKEDSKTGFMTADEVEAISWVGQLCTETPLGGEELGTYRPDLDKRKVGKTRVELVDDGFPLALREVAKVMTWAQTAKGYKDHDWLHLPDAQVQLAAAASRHRTDQITQHVVYDVPLLECVDPESKLVHKAHEAFGVLAQLELMLREKLV